MPSGYVKLVCDDCGGKLVAAGMPEFCISVPGRLHPEQIEAIQEALAEPTAIPILEEGIQIQSMVTTLVCESCGAVYEKSQ